MMALSKWNSICIQKSECGLKFWKWDVNYININNFNSPKDVCWWTLYQSQMIAAFQHAKGYLLSDRKTWNGDVNTPAGRRGEKMEYLVGQVSGGCWNRGRRECALSGNLYVDRKKWERGLKEQRWMEVKGLKNSKLKRIRMKERRDKKK